MLYGIRDFLQPVTVFPRKCLYSLLHCDGIFIGRICGKKDAIGRAWHKRHKADDKNDAKRHADSSGNDYDKVVQAGKKMADSRVHCRNRLAGVSSGLSDGKLHLVGTSLHLCLERHIISIIWTQDMQMQIGHFM